VASEKPHTPDTAAESRSGITTLSEDVHAALERHFGQRTD
jgi:hypothetical protein